MSIHILSADYDCFYVETVQTVQCVQFRTQPSVQLNNMKIQHFKLRFWCRRSRNGDMMPFEEILIITRS